MYASRHIIEIGVASAVLEFDNGTQDIRKIYQNADLLFGKFVTTACKKQDKNRISIIIHKPSGSVRKRRKKLSAIKK